MRGLHYLQHVVCISCNFIESKKVKWYPKMTSSSQVLRVILSLGQHTRTRSLSHSPLFCAPTPIKMSHQLSSSHFSYLQIKGQEWAYLRNGNTVWVSLVSTLYLNPSHVDRGKWACLPGQNIPFCITSRCALGNACFLIWRMELIIALTRRVVMRSK